MTRSIIASMLVIASCITILLSFASFVSASDPATQPIPPFATIGKNYVSGISAGGTMSVQLHTAYSSQFSGVGVFAGAPWACAGGTLHHSLHACAGNDTSLDLSHLTNLAQECSDDGRIDSIDNLSGAPVWVFHGTSDEKVKSSVVTATAAFYTDLGANVLFNSASPANHSWITPLGVNKCTESLVPFTANCVGLDLQNEMLTHMYQTNVQPRNAGALTGTIAPFSQDYYAMKKWGLPAINYSLDTTGFVYIPAVCLNAQISCDVHIVLHGCLQSYSQVGSALVTQSNMNEYADTNNFVVIYPQAIAIDDGVVFNPKACFDWWGYLETRETIDYTVKGSGQMEVIMEIINSLTTSATTTVAQS